jgi:hypothetical protein
VFILQITRSAGSQSSAGGERLPVRGLERRTREP